MHATRLTFLTKSCQDEDHGDTDAMAQGFYDLKNDIKGFLERFDEYLKEKGEELQAQAEELRQQINTIQDTLDK